MSSIDVCFWHRVRASVLAIVSCVLHCAELLQLRQVTLCLTISGKKAPRVLKFSVGIAQ